MDYSEDPTQNCLGDNLVDYFQVIGNEGPGGDLSFWEKEATKQFGVTSIVEPIKCLPIMRNSKAYFKIPKSRSYHLGIANVTNKDQEILTEGDSI